MHVTFADGTVLVVPMIDCRVDDAAGRRWRTTMTTTSTTTMMEEGASGRMGKTGQICAGGGKKGRVNEVVVGVDADDDDDDEDDDEEEEEEEEEEDASLPGLTSPEAASDGDVPSKSKRTAAASRFVDDEAEDGGGNDDDDDDDDDIQYNDVVDIPAKANDDAKDDQNDDCNEMSGGDGDIDFGPRDDPIDLDGPRAAADPRTADRPHYQWQSPFSPSSTPLDEPHRILCWNHVGVVTTPPAAMATISWTSPSTRPRALRRAEVL